MANILVVDDEQAICWGLAQLGEGLGHRVATAASAEQGLSLVHNWAPDLVILDVRLPGMDGLTAIQEFRQFVGTAPIVVITAFGDLETAVTAVRRGAFEYVLKPFDLASIRAVIDRALRQQSPTAAQIIEPADKLLGNTPVMQEVFKKIALAADSQAAVMLHGESGVGKELAARAIHAHNPRADGPFVAVNVAALNPSLAEAELFGHVEGAFTGANRPRTGLLAQANGGTLFLDEVADIPLPLQVKLLRMLDEGEFLPVGADRTVRSCFRVVSATHRDLQQAVRQGDFRHDLFFRLSTFKITVPPLRERVDDIPLLANQFARRFGGEGIVLDDATLTELKLRKWYGNVRELRNAIEHAVVLARTGAVLPEYLPPPQPRLDAGKQCIDEPHLSLLAEVTRRRAQELLDDPEAAGTVYERFLQEVEAPLLRGAMARFDDECAPAARALGIHRTTLRRKLDQYGTEESTS